MRNKAYRSVVILTAVIVAVVLATSFGCDRRSQGRMPSLDEPVNMSRIHWCADQHGNSAAYPCKWDSRQRPTQGWGHDTRPVALYVRASAGCPLPLPKEVSCYWAPQDQ